MRSLAISAVDVVPGKPIEGRVWRRNNAEAQQSLELYCEALQRKVRPGELVCEFTANLQVDPEMQRLEGTAAR